MHSVPLCPKCEVLLVRDLKGALEADVCPQCGGMLLSRQGWHLALEDWESALALENTYTDNNPMPILALEVLCPLCREPMTPVYPPEAPNLPVDMCLQCGSFWLDDGELGRLVEAVRTRAHQATPKETGKPETEGVPLSEMAWVYCTHCGRQNFADAEKCWACGEPLEPERPPLSAPWQVVAEVMSMTVGGAGAVLFGLFVTRPQGEKLAAFGLGLMVIGLFSLATLRRLWRRGRKAPFFPTFSDQ